MTAAERLPELREAERLRQAGIGAPAPAHDVQPLGIAGDEGDRGRGPARADFAGESETGSPARQGQIE